MNPPSAAISRISIQRSFWLRCFLGRSVAFVVFILLSGGTARANVCVYKTFYVHGVYGYVSDLLHERIPGATILLKDLSGKVVAQSVGNEQGEFRIKAPSGTYWLVVEAQGFAPGRAYLRVGFGIRSMLHSNSIHIVVTPGVICGIKASEPFGKTIRSSGLV
jgi:hypothetical protein